MASRIVRKIERPDANWIKKYKVIPTSIISDCLGRTQATDATMKPIFSGIRLCGPAITVQAISGSNLMSHYVLTMALPGDALVVDARGGIGNSVWGNIQTIYAIKVGVVGLVLDGAIRDIEEIRKNRFPVYCKGATPAGPHKGWVDNVNVPVQCGGMPVHPGDLIVGDDDGVVAIPLDLIGKVYREACERMKSEKQWIKSIEQGKSSLEAVGLVKYLPGM